MAFQSVGKINFCKCLGEFLGSLNHKGTNGFTFLQGVRVTSRLSALFFSFSFISSFFIYLFFFFLFTSFLDTPEFTNQPATEV